MQTFRFSYGTGVRWLLVVLGMGPRFARVDVDPESLHVRAGIWFRATIPRSHVVRVESLDGKWVISRGVHGWGGDWLVNGSSDGLVRIDIEPRVRVRTIGIPVRLRRLTLSLEDPDAFLAALNA